MKNFFFYNISIASFSAKKETVWEVNGLPLNGELAVELVNSDDDDRAFTCEIM